MSSYPMAKTNTRMSQTFSMALLACSSNYHITQHNLNKTTSNLISSCLQSISLPTTLVVFRILLYNCNVVHKIQAVRRILF